MMQKHPGNQMICFAWPYDASIHLQVSKKKKKWIFFRFWCIFGAIFDHLENPENLFSGPENRRKLVQNLNSCVWEKCYRCSFGKTKHHTHVTNIIEYPCPRITMLKRLFRLESSLQFWQYFSRKTHKLKNLTFSFKIGFIFSETFCLWVQALRNSLGQYFSDPP